MYSNIRYHVKAPLVKLVRECSKSRSVKERIPPHRDQKFLAVRGSFVPHAPLFFKLLGTAWYGTPKEREIGRKGAAGGVSSKVP